VGGLANVREWSQRGNPLPHAGADPRAVAPQPRNPRLPRGLATEFDVSPNAVRVELNNLRKHKVLTSERDGRNVLSSRANTKHPLFPELSSMVRKITGIDELGEVRWSTALETSSSAYLIGDYAREPTPASSTCVLVGDIDRVQLDDFAGKTEAYIDRKIRSLVLSRKEFERLQHTKSFKPILNCGNRQNSFGR